MEITDPQEAELCWSTTRSLATLTPNQQHSSGKDPDTNTGRPHLRQPLNRNLLSSCTNLEGRGCVRTRPFRWKSQQPEHSTANTAKHRASTGAPRKKEASQTHTANSRTAPCNPIPANSSGNRVVHSTGNSPSPRPPWPGPNNPPNSQRAVPARTSKTGKARTPNWPAIEKSSRKPPPGGAGQTAKSDSKGEFVATSAVVV
jgi:hypothetical protein